MAWRDDDHGLTSALANRAASVMPGGASHDGRQLIPHGLFVRQASGAHKAGEDGRSYIDLQCGNGSLLLGHGFRPAVEAGMAALGAGFNFSAGSASEIRWAETVHRLMPAVEQVRFTASGNEACALAFAVARAVTGRGPALRLRGHYCGWVPPALLSQCSARTVMSASAPPEAIVLAEAADLDDAVQALASGRFSAVMVEPTGASFGRIPLAFDDVRVLAAAAKRGGSLLIFDETITGFRVAPGGAQQLCGVTPDLTVLGKILGGGLPCGALAGRRAQMRVLDNRPGQADGAHVSHMGTGNGNPVVAATGTATLAAIEDGAAIARANAASARLRAGLNTVFGDLRIGWAAFGEHSALHLFLNPLARRVAPQDFEAETATFEELSARSPALTNELRIRLLDHGVDINAWPGGLLSAAHSDEIVDDALARFESALSDLKKADAQLEGWGRA